MDISNFVAWFINQFTSLFVKIFNLLDSITFLGTSILDYTITLLILGVVLNIVISVSKSRTVREVSKDDRKHKENDD